MRSRAVRTATSRLPRKHHLRVVAGKGRGPVERRALFFFCCSVTTIYEDGGESFESWSPNRECLALLQRDVVRRGDTVPRRPAFRNELVLNEHQRRQRFPRERILRGFCLVRVRIQLLVGRRIEEDFMHLSCDEILLPRVDVWKRVATAASDLLREHRYG